MKPIDLSKVVVSRKLSLLEHDMKRLLKGESEMLNYYRKIGADFEKIIASDKAQKESFIKVLDFFPKAKVFEGRVLRKNFCSQDSLVIVLGGDNYFQYVSHFLDSQLVIGINSDPLRSEGVLTLFNAESFGELFDSLKKGNVRIEEWTRLQITLDGKIIVPKALSEVYIGSKERYNISKYKISFKDLEEEQKSSGVLVATGCGSTGWYNSAFGGCHEQSSDVFPKTAKEAHFLVTEIFKGKLNFSELKNGVIENGEKLEIINSGKHESVVSVDSKLNFKFSFGAQVEIGLSEQSLNVICPAIY